MSDYQLEAQSKVAEEEEQRRPRYITTTVSVGAAGLTARPAVWDRKLQRVVHSYRRGQEHLARAMAEKLNAEDR